MMDLYQEFIAKSRYCRWLEDEGRRETWREVCERYTGFWHNRGLISSDERVEFTDVIEGMEAMPSMRALMTAGPALDRDNVAGYNCSYVTVDGNGESIDLEHEKLDDHITVHLRDVVAFDELMYVLLCGTGVGFSVERQYINTLPKVGKPLNRRRYLPFKTNYPGVPKDDLSVFDKTDNTIRVADSKYGWASSIRILIIELYNGNFDIQWDLSALRPAGAQLKTFGGRASGPEPLNKLMLFIQRVFKEAEGRRLNSLECHDICCSIAAAVVVGGVRRSATISLSNLTDDRMRRAKSGDWRQHSKQRELANNSICYTEKPDFPAFMNEWGALYESYSGERGIFNRGASVAQAARSTRRDTGYDFGPNPCCEIILRPRQFCNLSEIVIRENDTLADLRRKVRYATIFGTLQASLTDFVYLQPDWAKNCIEEALLGVSFTGIMDHKVMSGKKPWTEFTDVDFVTLEETLAHLLQVAIDTNKEWAERIGINQSTAITCVKPSGTVSQLVDSASGIHPRYSSHYIRRVRVDKHDPVGKFMADKGVPYQTDETNYIFEFPHKSPDHAVTAGEFLGIKQLELWKIYQDHWCEHKPSITVYYRNEDFYEIGQWVYNHFDEISGVSFLPYDDHVYEMAPYEPIDHDMYTKLKKAMPETINWSELDKYENTDNTIGSQELACTGSACDVVDLIK
jgi:ribonucleoside-diphosphate reductase alpha chain